MLAEFLTCLGFKTICDNPNNFFSNNRPGVFLLDFYEISINDNFIALGNWLHVVAIVDELTPDFRSSLRIHRMSYVLCD